MSGNTAKRRSASRATVQRVGSARIKLKQGKNWVNECIAVLFFAGAVFLLLSFVSHELSDGLSPGANIMGPVGHVSATVLSGIFGWCTVVPILWLSWMANHFYFKDEEGMRYGDYLPRLSVVIGLCGILLFSSVLVSVLWGAKAGGAFGSSWAVPLARLFSSVGAALICFSFLILSVALATGTALSTVVESMAKSVTFTLKHTLITLPAAIFKAILILGYSVYYLLSWMGRQVVPARAKKPGKRESEEPDLPRPKTRRERDALLKSTPTPDVQPPEDYSHVVVMRRTANFNKAKAAAKNSSKAEPVAAPVKYVPPDMSLLTKGEISVSNENDQELRDISRQIETKLRDFSIQGRVTQVHPGPVITLFEFEPAPGVKVGRIAALQDDLAMSLRASSIRIIAPIPKRGTVGIEVPNKHREIVRLRDTLESEQFQQEESFLAVAVGKDTYGEPVVVDVATMPHLLVAGATGTGKSVTINTLLVSLLYRASPNDLGLILIDPKILELSIYEGIPHLRVPVVTHPRQAKAVLQWAVNEMERRYRMLQRFGVRSIDGYNRIVAGESEGEIKRTSTPEEPIVLGEERIVEEGEGEQKPKDPVEITEKLEKLPKIVIVIDELADLMLAVGRDIEELITRLAQKARASGIHLIVATQRPSVDVITGLIKANFPARLSFRVVSRIDSRTILDSMGAERLLGRGDMLFMQPGAESLKRVHGAFVSDSEVKKVIDAVKKNGAPKYDERIMALCDKALEENSEQGSGSGADGGESEYDEFYDKAVELVTQKGYASTSMIQRAFRIGYNRAARLIEMMEREGIVGPMDGAKPREVLIPGSGEGQ